MAPVYFGVREEITPFAVAAIAFEQQRVALVVDQLVVQIAERPFDAKVWHRLRQQFELDAPHVGFARIDLPEPVLTRGVKLLRERLLILIAGDEHRTIQAYAPLCELRFRSELRSFQIFRVERIRLQVGWPGAELEAAAFKPGRIA